MRLLQLLFVQRTVQRDIAVAELFKRTERDCIGSK